MGFWNIKKTVASENTGKVTPNLFQIDRFNPLDTSPPPSSVGFLFFLPQPVSEDKRAWRREVCHQGRVMKINDDINLLWM